MGDAMAWRSPIFPLVLGLTLMNSWILFEQLVVDRYGLWRYMPFYRVTDPCVWDLAALIATVALIISLRRAGRI
jgi:hypothetical protein